MLELAHHFDEPVEADGVVYRARIYGSAEPDGRWAGWAVFFPPRGGRVIATARETTQSSLADLAYWSSGLTHTYLRGALERALALQPEEQLARELQRLARLEHAMEQEAQVLEAAASRARRQAEAAEAERARTERDLASLASATRAEAIALDLAADAPRARAKSPRKALRARSPSAPKKK